MVDVIKIAAVAALALVFGQLVSNHVGILRRLSIPAALIGGLLLLMLGPEVLTALPSGLYESWRGWPGFLITFLFIGIILSEPAESFRSPRGMWREVAQQTLYVWFIGISELALGFLLVLTVLAGSGTPPLFAHIIEIGWIGGHGAAGAFNGIATGLGQPVAGALGIFSATMGLIVGGTVGLVLVQYVRRRAGAHGAPHSGAEAAGESPGGNTYDPTASQERALLIAIVLFLALGLGATLLREGAALVLQTLGQNRAGDFVRDFPLFSIALVVTVLARGPLGKLGLLSNDIARQSAFLTGLVLDALVLTATATLKLEGTAQHLPAFLVLMAGATAWTVIVFLFLAPRLLPRDCWQELGILNYGMSTGVTAIGLMLVRSLRGSVSPRVGRVYGMAAPFSAPLIGGGAISLMLPGLTAQGYGFQILAGLLVVALLLLGVALFLRRKG